MAASQFHRSADFWRTVRIWIFSSIGLVALGGFFYFLATLGPKKVGVEAVAATDDPAMASLSKEISELEGQYQQAVDAELITDAARDALAKALEKQKELLRTFTYAGPDQATRLARLECALDSLRASEKLNLIETLQADGEKLLDAQKIEEAGAKLREAYRLQKEINVSAASAKYKNYVRETSLSQALAALDAAPLKAEKDAALAKARTAVAEQRWADALSAYTLARDKQERINREYGRTRYADLMEADRLSSEIESLNASDVALEIDTKEKLGDAALGEKRASEAASLFEAAMNLQIQVNQNYARSRFVSTQRVEGFEIKRQTALSSGVADRLEQLDREIGAHLRKRQTVSAEQKIEEASGLVAKLFTDFPKSSRLDGGLRTKISYLTLLRPQISTVQNQVYDGLLPLPSALDHRMFRTEIPQSLYVLVMSANPSRNPGRAFPVDSVSWADAQDFCTRLSWLLGLPVRLPTLDEYRVAYSESSGQVWSSENSDARSHEVATKSNHDVKFSDLIGNLAEWSSNSEDADRASTFGGSYLDRADSLSKLPVEVLRKSDRARHIGFRIVLEL